MKTKQIAKNQKPIDIDLHLKYECQQCSTIHWLSLKEVQTKNFKVICDCNLVIKPKTIKKIKLLYSKKSVKQQLQKDSSEEISLDLLEKCVTILLGYGFEKQESESLIKQCYLSNPNINCVDLIKLVLKSFGSNTNEQYSSNNI
jgi:Holliday junction resolvasome RuvABC DNA-binding subunit